MVVEGKIGNVDALYSGGYFKRQVNNRIDYTGYTIGYDQCNCGYTAFYPGGNPALPLGNQDPTQYTDNYDTYTKLTNEIRFTSATDQRFGGYWVPLRNTRPMTSGSSSGSTVCRRFIR